MIRLLFLMLVCGATSAAELHKCVDGDGRVSYQSSACASGSRTLWVRNALPEAVPPRPAAQVASKDAGAAMGRASATPIRISARPPARKRADACTTARRSA